MSKIKITIDGSKCKAKPGQTVLEVAQEHNIEIPTLCYNEELSRTTSCFVCVVKDITNDRFIPSCSAKAADGMEVATKTEEVRDMRQTALNLLLSEHTGDCEAPCKSACPADVKVEEYLRKVRRGNFKQALKIIKEDIPLPLSIGRICPRFCEDDCRRNVLDEEAVAIDEIKRLVADLCYDEYAEELPELGNKRVAIVGAGPAGYSIAYYLRLNGIGCDIYEKMPQPGGMLRYGIPEYRLPKEILDQELEHFEKMGGIEVYCNQELGVDIELEELKADYEAVAVAVGSWKPSSMYTKGEELAEWGIEFLEEVARSGWQGADPGKTIVVGGGNTAMDCLRTALRLSSDQVYCYYRRSEKQMPADQIEIDEAREEGAKFKFLAQPVSLHEEGDKQILTCTKMKLGEKDASGRRKPIPIEGSEFEVKADTVIAAIGQDTEAPEGLPTNQWGDVDAVETTGWVEDNIFAAGDCVTGPATVVEALAAGQKTACSISAYLAGENYEQSTRINVSRGHWQSLAKEDLVFLDEPIEKTRVVPEYINQTKREATFKEAKLTISKEEGKAEAERCLECSCVEKEDCQLRDYGEEYGADPETLSGEIVDFDYDARHPDIIRDPNKCIKCGQCVKICKEVINENLLNFKNRGYQTKVGTVFEQPLPESCTECGECIETCPVGALAWKEKE